MINKEIKNWLKKNDIGELTSVQKRTIPLILENKNVLITAPTGYGKTLAAVIPVFQNIMKKEGLRILYIAPTKSLNRDIFNRVFEFAEHLGLKISVRHGDTTSYEKHKQVINPPSILITTPESVQGMLISENMKKNLKNLDYVIVDEVHELINSKRGTQFNFCLERLKRFSDFTTIGISATISDINEVAEFLCNGGEYDIINIGGVKEMVLDVVNVKPDSEDKVVAEKNYFSPKIASVLRRIKKDLENNERTLIFVNTRHHAEVLSSLFKKIYPELRIGVHHSSLSKKHRIKMEDDLRKGNIKALISTSSMELGIDVGSISLVVQFMSPRQVNKIVQRVGRSGHVYFKKSKGRIYCLNTDDYLESLSIKQLVNEEWLEKPVIHKNSFDVISHQIIGFCRDSPISFDELYERMKKAYCFSIGKEKFSELINFLKSLGYLKKNDKLEATWKGFQYYFKNVSTIPDMKYYIVNDIQSNKRIGALDEGFILEYGSTGSVIILKGEAWKILEVEENIVNVTRTHNYDSAVPSWTGEMIPVEKRVAWRVGVNREEYFSKDFHIPDKNSILIESYENKVIMHSCNGTRINNALSTALSSLISARTGFNIGVMVDPYRIIFTIPPNYSHKIVLEELKKITPENLVSILRLSVKNTALFTMRFFNVAQRFGIISRNSEFSKRRVFYTAEQYEDTLVYEETFNEIFNEKFDIDGAKSVVKKLSDERISIIVSDKVSPISISGLNLKSFSNILKNPESYGEIYDIVEKRLLSKKFHLVCNNCDKDLGVFSVENIPYNKCPGCGMGLISFYSPGQEPDKKWMEETAELFLNYGKKSCFVIAGYGVGPRTARRIIHFRKELLLKKIIRAERTFVRTRQYWE